MGHVNCACILSDSKDVSAGATLGHVLLFPIDPSVKPLKPTRHQNSVKGVSTTGDKRLVTGSDDRSVRVWTPPDSLVIQPNIGPIKCVSASERGHVILFIGKDGSSSIWDIQMGELTVTLVPHAASPT
jgi:WD40 repeat protein